ncbi:MAG: hypothetical protein U9N33_06840 [Campylobacterota bacterium]|nr:hypothetical protein [Campylobacterota bacterium]
MFSFFLSKNQKLVKQWKKEHQQLVALAHKIIKAYEEGDDKATKKELLALKSLAMNHLMMEDIELYRLLKDKGQLDKDAQKLALEFKNSFRGTKTALMEFLTASTRNDAVLDEKFFETFNAIVGILAERIAFEEENLYTNLASS